MKKLLALTLIAAAGFPASATPLTMLTTNTVDGVAVEFQWRYDADFAAHTAKLLNVTPKPTEKLEIPNSLYISGLNETLAVIEIGESAFENARALTDVKIPPSVEKIGDFAFSNCTALSSVEISYGLRRIGKRPFVNTAIPELVLPDSLIEMDGNITAGAIYDMNLLISESSHFAFSADGVLYNKDMTKLYACPTRTEGIITIPDSVTNICADAFFGCFRLTYINLPKNVNAIGSGAFNVGGIWPGLSAPESTPKLLSVFYNGAVPNAPDDIYDGAPDYLTNYVFTSGWDNPWKGRPVEMIDEAAPPVLTYKDEDGITWYYRIVNGEAELYNNGEAAIAPKSIDGNRNGVIRGTFLLMPSSINGFVVTKIGDHAFDGCNNLANVDIPPSIREIGKYAFKGCSAISAIRGSTSDAAEGEIAIPNGVTTIGYRPFEGMNSRVLSIPYTLQNITGNPLLGLKFLTTVEADASNPNFATAGNVLYDKRYTTVIGVPANYDEMSVSFRGTTQKIGAEALHGCINLETVPLPASLETISSNAFAGCSSLKALAIPATVTEIGSAAFTNCSYLAKVEYAGNAPTTPDDLYAGTPETMASWISEGATGFSDGTWRGRPVVVVSGGESEDKKGLYYNDGAITWYFRIDADGMAEIYNEGKTAVVSDTPITTLNLPETLGGYLVKGIGEGAFANLRGIQTVSIPSGYEWIGDYAFSNCTALASVEIPYGVRSIGKRVFVNTIIPELTLPDSLINMGGNIAAGAIYDMNLIISDSSHFTFSDDGVLYNKDMTKLYACPTRAEGTITIPESVTNICTDAFFGCFRLTYLNLPAAVNTIGSDAFNVSGIWPGLIPAPESCHAIAATIREALKCKETGEKKTILFNLSGHGFVDMSAYDSYFSGEMTNYVLTDEELAKYQASADALNQ